MYNRQIKIQKPLSPIKSIFIGVILCPIFIFFWVYYYGESTWNELQLITQKTEVVIGYIYQEEVDYDVIESNDGRSAEESTTYYFKYKFIPLIGGVIHSQGKNIRSFSEEPEKVNEENPTEVKVEYVKSNPNISRIANNENDDNLWSWFRHNLIVPTFILSILVFISYLSIGSGKQEYKIRKQIKVEDD